MNVDLNTNINSLQNTQNAELASALSKLGVAQTAPKKLFGNAPSVVLTEAEMDLNKLVDQLNGENSDVKTKAAKIKLSGAYETIIARAKETRDISEANMKHLNNAEELTGQLKPLEQNIEDTQKEINTKQKEIASLEKDVSKLDKDIKNLDKRIALEKDPKKLMELAKQREALVNQRAGKEAELKQANVDLGSLNTQLNTLKTKYSDTKKQISDELAAIDDENVIREMADALKMDATDVSNYLEDDKKERSEMLEQYMDTHTPWRIIQDAKLHNDEQILNMNTIDENRKIQA